MYVGTDGLLHKVKDGADTVLPFNKLTYLLHNGEIVSSDIIAIGYTNGSYTIEEDSLGKNLYINTYGAQFCFKTNLTNYNKILLACRCNDSNNQFDAYISSTISKQTTYNKGSYLDVSSYSGIYYVCCGYDNGKIHVYDIIAF